MNTPLNINQLPLIMQQQHLITKTERVIHSAQTMDQLMTASSYVQLAKRYIISPHRRMMLDSLIRDKFAEVPLLPNQGQKHEA